MTWRSAPRCAAAVLLVVLCGCRNPETDGVVSRGSAAAELRLVDASGREVVLPAPARRVVSLVPSATETLHAMGRDDVLVGRTDYDTWPWAAGLPSVGGGLEPNLEAVVALRPDLVVRFSGEQDTRTPRRLDELGIPHLAVRPDRLEDIYATVALLGHVIGDPVTADSVARAIRAGLAEASARAKSLPEVRFLYVLGGTPPWVSGSGTYISQVLALMGGINAFEDLGALYASVSPEQLRARPVDVVLLSRESTFDTTLTPGARVEVVGDALELPGPGVVDAAYFVGELLHGRNLR